jgi:hypothetical protein
MQSSCDIVQIRAGLYTVKTFANRFHSNTVVMVFKMRRCEYTVSMRDRGTFAVYHEHSPDRILTSGMFFGFGLERYGLFFATRTSGRNVYSWKFHIGSWTKLFYFHYVFTLINRCEVILWSQLNRKSVRQVELFAI